MSIILIFISYLIFELLSLFKALSLNYLVFSIKKFRTIKYGLVKLGISDKYFFKRINS